MLVAAEESTGTNIFNVPVNNDCFSMLLFSAIFVFKMNIILQWNYIQQFSARPDMTFSCKQKQNLNRFEISYRSFFISGLM